MNAKVIVFPTDFSDSSDAALGYASALASESGASLRILHVTNDTSSYIAAYGGFGYEPDLTEQVKRENRKRLEQIRPTIPDAKYTHVCLSGLAEQEILTYAEQEHADFIVLGSHGRTGISRLLLGSVAEAVVRGAKCPVLTIKQPLPEADESADSKPDKSHSPEGQPPTDTTVHLEPITKFPLH